MLTAAVASKDPKSGENLRACLEQTGLVKPVMGFTMSGDGESKLGSGRSLPEIMLLDLSTDIGPYFAFAAKFRHLHPAGYVIACSPWQPGPDLLVQAMRAGVNEFLSKPIDHVMLQGVLRRFVGEHGTADKDEARKLIIVVGVKGGVGTTTVAINLGVQLIGLSKGRAILFDLARPLGHVALLLDLKPRFSICDAVENLERLDTSFLGGLLMHHKSGLEVLPGTSHPDDWERLSIASIVRMVNVAQSTFDFVVIDFGSAFSNEWMPVLELARTVLLVAEPNVPAFSNLHYLLSALARPRFPRDRIRIVINRCQPGEDKLLRNREEIADLPVAAWLASDFRQVSEATNLGVPLSRKSKNPLLGQLQRLACDLAGLQPPRGFVEQKSITHALGARSFQGQAR
jgi:pilus assembly protein CpaE